MSQKAVLSLSFSLSLDLEKNRRQSLGRAPPRPEDPRATPRRQGAATARKWFKKKENKELTFVSKRGTKSFALFFHRKKKQRRIFKTVEKKPQTPGRRAAGEATRRAPRRSPANGRRFGVRGSFRPTLRRPNRTGETAERLCAFKKTAHLSVGSRQRQGLLRVHGQGRQPVPKRTVFFFKIFSFSKIEALRDARRPSAARRWIQLSSFLGLNFVWDTSPGFRRRTRLRRSRTRSRKRARPAPNTRRRDSRDTFPKICSGNCGEFWSGVFLRRRRLRVSRMSRDTFFNCVKRGLLVVRSRRAVTICVGESIDGVDDPAKERLPAGGGPALSLSLSLHSLEREARGEQDMNSSRGLDRARSLSKERAASPDLELAGVYLADLYLTQALEHHAKALVYCEIERFHQDYASFVRRRPGVPRRVLSLVCVTVFHNSFFLSFYISFIFQAALWTSRFFAAQKQLALRQAGGGVWKSWLKF